MPDSDVLLVDREEIGLGNPSRTNRTPRLGPIGLPYPWRVREDLTRAWLAHYGAPVVGQSLVAGRVPPELAEVVVDGLALSRRDASVARALPVLLWSRRAELEMAKLRRLAASKGRERTFGFFLDLTARLSGDRRLRNAAAALRPVRPPTQTKFFTRRESQLARMVAEKRTPPVARAWGYRMNMPMDSFRSLFEKFSVPNSRRGGGMRRGRAAAGASGRKPEPRRAQRVRTRASPAEMRVVPRVRAATQSSQRK